jgi:tetratricopeptide (TPR) repeat protein
MSMFDQSGHPVQLGCSTALDAWNGTVRGFLAHSADTPDQLETVLHSAPGFALARIAKAFFLLLLGRAETDRAARDTARECEALATQGALDAREDRYMAALRDWLAGCPSAAAARLDEVAQRWPGDALAVKLSHAIRFMMGHRFAMREATSHALNAYGPDHPYAGYIHGCHAFALEETGDYAGAERTGRRALELAGDDAWAIHAVTHVYDMTGRSAYGARFVLDNEPAWRHCNNFGYHVWWHLALFYLDGGDLDSALALYDNHVRRERTDDYRDISNATSLLARLELEGVDVGARWDELADLAEKRLSDASVVFADLHYMLALSATGRDSAERLVARLRRDPENSSSEMAVVAGHAGYPAARGLQLFKKADYASAYAHLATARPYLQSIGGSHAQRDVFERILIDAAILAGELTEAGRLIEHRNRLRAGVPDRFAKARLAWIATLSAHSETAA